MLLLLETDLKVVGELLFGSGTLLLDVKQLPVIGQHDHQLVGVTQTQVRQHRGVLQVFSPLLIGKKSLAEGKGEHEDEKLSEKKSTLACFAQLCNKFKHQKHVAKVYRFVDLSQSNTAL